MYERKGVKKEPRSLFQVESTSHTFFFVFENQVEYLLNPGKGAGLEKAVEYFFPRNQQKAEDLRRHFSFGIGGRGGGGQHLNEVSPNQASDRNVDFQQLFSSGAGGGRRRGARGHLQFLSRVVGAEKMKAKKGLNQ